MVFPCCNSRVSVTGRNCGLSGCGWHYFNPWMYTCHNDCCRCYVDTNPSVYCWEQRLIVSILWDDRLEMEWLQLVCMGVVRPGFSSSNMSHRHGRPALVLRISPFISLQEAASQATQSITLCHCHLRILTSLLEDAELSNVAKVEKVCAFDICY